MILNNGFKKTLIWLTIGISVVAFGILLVAGYHFYMEYLQIQEVGSNFVSVFSKNAIVHQLIQLVSFFIVFLAIFFSLLRVRKTMLSVDESFQFLKPMFPIWILSFTLAVFAGNFIKDAVGSKFLMMMNTTEWGLTDPIFGQDVSYYVFIRPFVMTLFDSAMGIAIFVSILVSVLYILLYGRLGVTNLKEFVHNKKIITHIVFQLLIIVLIHLGSYKFKAEDMLFSEFAELSGAGFTDIHIWLKYYKILPYVGVVVIIGVLLFLHKAKFKYAIFTALIIPVVLIGFTASALITQYFHVNPAEVQMEAPYIGYHIEATRMAYGIHDMEEQEFAVNNEWSYDDVVDNQAAIDQISLLDLKATHTILGQLQGIRDFYEFIDIDTVNYEINGTKEAFMVSPRELRKLEESPTSQSYSNDKMRFTHGYGMVMLPADSVTADGHPTLYVKNSPIVSSVSELQVTEPRIYYGEYDDDYSIVNTHVKEFDYLSNGLAVENAYHGKSGIPLNGLNRLLLSICYGDYQLLTSNFITADSKLLMNTNVLDRVKIAAPFLTFDEDPYLLVDSEGRLKWIVDAYTTTKHFPYAMKYEDDFNYIRNSAKAVVDAYDGTVEIYITDPTDKIINVYQKIYPEVFMTKEFPASLKQSLRYPETYFNIQTEVLKRYHIKDAATFYNRSDDWEIAKEIFSETSSWTDSISEDQAKVQMKPSYQMLTRDGEQELTLMIPFTEKGKDSMVAWFMAGSDGDCYGTLSLVQFPQDATVYGPLQIEKRINSDPEIAQIMSAWGSGESTIIRGNLITVPVGDSILYVEPIYVTAGKNTFPELKMVVAAYDSKITIRPTLQQAVEALFIPTEIEEPLVEQPVVPPEIVPEDPLLPEDIGGTDLQRITEAFNRVQIASQSGNWEEFGKAMAELKSIIDELNGLPVDMDGTSNSDHSETIVP